MARTSLRAAFLAGLALALGNSAQANPQVAAILKYTPTQPGIQLSTPTAAEQDSCKVEVVAGARAGSSGYVLTDAKGNKLRTFFDTNADKKVDVWSYFKDGVEVYREIDTNGNDRADMYRWLGSAGMKWGQDSDEDGKIDAWRMISAEEATEEAFQAIAKNDFNRFRALLITEEDMKFLKLPAAEVERLTTLQKNAQAKFQATAAKLPHLATAKFERLESAIPSCTPANGELEKDLIRFTSRLILFKHSPASDKDQKHDWLDTGELIQVGYSWRLTDVPAPYAIGAPAGSAPTPPSSPELQKVLAQLDTLDKAHQGSPLLSPTKDEKIAAYNLQRVDLIKQILPLVDAKDRDNWTRQMCDNLSTAFQAGSEKALAELGALRDGIAKTDKASNLIPYAVYREMWAQFSVKVANTVEAKKLADVQDEWLENLSKFVTAYPKADDTADALHQLAMGSEYAGRDEVSKRWYNQIYTQFPLNAYAEKAKGAERRLGLIGREMELNADLINGSGKLNIANNKGKVVVVYYWSSFVSVCSRDFATLKQLAILHGDKGLEIVTVNLDDSKDAALKFLAASPIPGSHVGDYGKDSGLSSALATYYGINSLPTVFIVGRDGRVMNRTVQVNDIEDVLKKAL